MSERAAKLAALRERLSPIIADGMAVDLEVFDQKPTAEGGSESGAVESQVVEPAATSAVPEPASSPDQVLKPRRRAKARVEKGKKPRNPSASTASPGTSNVLVSATVEQPASFKESAPELLPEGGQLKFTDERGVDVIVEKQGGLYGVDDSKDFTGFIYNEDQIRTLIKGWTPLGESVLELAQETERQEQEKLYGEVERLLIQQQEQWLVRIEQITNTEEYNALVDEAVEIGRQYKPDHPGIMSFLLGEPFERLLAQYPQVSTQTKEKLYSQAHDLQGKINKASRKKASDLLIMRTEAPTAHSGASTSAHDAFPLVKTSDHGHGVSQNEIGEVTSGEARGERLERYRAQIAAGDFEEAVIINRDTPSVAGIVSPEAAADAGIDSSEPFETDFVPFADGERVSYLTLDEEEGSVEKRNGKYFIKTGDTMLDANDPGLSEVGMLAEAQKNKWRFQRELNGGAPGAVELPVFNDVIRNASIGGESNPATASPDAARAGERREQDYDTVREGDVWVLRDASGQELRRVTVNQFIKYSGTALQVNFSDSTKQLPPVEDDFGYLDVDLTRVDTEMVLDRFLQMLRADGFVLESAGTGAGTTEVAPIMGERRGMDAPDGRRAEVPVENPDVAVKIEEEHTVPTTLEEKIAQLRQEKDEFRYKFAESDFKNSTILGKLGSIFRELDKNKKDYDTDTWKRYYLGALEQLKDAELEQIKKSGLTGEILNDALAGMLEYYKINEPLGLIKARTRVRLETKIADKEWPEQIMDRMENIGREYNKLNWKTKVLIGGVFIGGAFTLGSTGAAGAAIGGGALFLRKIVTSIGGGLSLDATLEKVEDWFEKKSDTDNKEIKKQMARMDDIDDWDKFEGVNVLLDQEIASLDGKLQKHKSHATKRKLIAFGTSIGFSFGSYAFGHGAPSAGGGAARTTVAAAAAEAKRAAIPSGAAASGVARSIEQAASAPSGAASAGVGQAPMPSGAASAAMEQATPPQANAAASAVAVAERIAAPVPGVDTTPPVGAAVKIAAETAAAIPGKDLLINYSVTPADARKGLWGILEKRLPADMSEAERPRAIQSLSNAIARKLQEMDPEDWKKVGFPSGEVGDIRAGGTIDFARLLNPDDVQKVLNGNFIAAPPEIPYPTSSIVEPAVDVALTVGVDASGLAKQVVQEVVSDKLSEVAAVAAKIPDVSSGEKAAIFSSFQEPSVPPKGMPIEGVHPSTVVTTYVTERATLLPREGMIRARYGVRAIQYFQEHPGEWGGVRESATRMRDSLFFDPNASYNPERYARLGQTTLSSVLRDAEAFRQNPLANFTYDRTTDPLSIRAIRQVNDFVEIAKRTFGVEGAMVAAGESINNYVLRMTMKGVAEGRPIRFFYRS